LGRTLKWNGKWENRPLRSRKGWSLPGWVLILTISCTGTIEKSVFEEETPRIQQEQEVVSFSEQGFRFALTHLENGDFEGAREALKEIVQKDDNIELASKVEFFLGVIKLLEMEDLERMSVCRDDFQKYADEHPGGPYRELAEQIVCILDAHINLAKKDQKRIRELTQQMSDQEKVIQNLQAQIKNLEDIHRRAEERRRQLLDAEERRRQLLEAE